MVNLMRSGASRSLSSWAWTNCVQRLLLLIWNPESWPLCLSIKDAKLLGLTANSFVLGTTSLQILEPGGAKFYLAPQTLAFIPFLEQKVLNRKFFIIARDKQVVGWKICF